jgi:hypothetical protein
MFINYFCIFLYLTMLEKISQVLTRIDLFGKTLIFEEKHSQRHNTTGGLIFTFLLLVVTCIIGFLFGKEIYERKYPVVVNSKEIISYSRINTQDYPIFFSFSLKDGTGVKQSEDVFDVIISQITMDENLYITAKNYQGLTKKCDITVFPKIYQPIINETYRNMDNNQTGRELFCLHKDGLYFQNNYMEKNSTMIGLRFFRCNPNKRKCHPQMDQILKEMYVSVFTVDAFVDPENYTNPITYSSKGYTQQVNNIFTKRSFVNVEKGILKTHKGWLFENNVDEEYFSQKEITVDVNPSVDNDFYRITFISGNLRTKDIRSYMKIQDLLAKLGGFYNGLLLICYVLIKDYVDFDYYNSIYDNLQKSYLIKSKIQSKNNTNSNVNLISNYLENNNITKEKNNFSRRLDNGDKLKENNVSNECLNNNFLKQVVRINDFKKSEEGKDQNDAKILPNIIPNQAFNSKHKLNSHMLILNEDMTSNNYFIYLLNDLILCRSTKYYKIKEVKEILSYSNIVTMSFENLMAKLNDKK